MNKKLIIIFLVIVGFCGLLVLILKKNSSGLTPLYIGKTKILVEIADTPEKRSQGLSRRKTLANNTGMLFVFEQAGIHSFWMKDMLFPLDFIWIANKQVVELSENVPKPINSLEQPKVVIPKQPIDMVIEVNAGFVKSNNIKVGNKVIFNP